MFHATTQHFIRVIDYTLSCSPEKIRVARANAACFFESIISIYLYLSQSFNCSSLQFVYTQLRWDFPWISHIDKNEFTFQAGESGESSLVSLYSNPPGPKAKLPKLPGCSRFFWRNHTREKGKPVPTKNQFLQWLCLIFLMENSNIS